MDPVKLDGNSSLSQQESNNEKPVFDETWDIQSPLFSRSSPLLEASTQRNSIPVPVEPEGIAMIEVERENEDGFFDPWKNLLTICAMIMSMFFFVLVTGSFFFPWSYTTFRITMDTINSLPFDFSVPLSVDTKFEDILSIFNQSHSNTLVVLITVSTVVVPSLLMLSQVVFMYFINQNPNNNCTDIEGRKKKLYLLKRFLSLPLYCAKFSMSIIYVNSMLLVATSKVRLKLGGDYSPDDQNITMRNDDSNGDYIYAEIKTATRGGLVAYTIGTIFSTFAFMIFTHLLDHNDGISDDEINLTHLVDENEILTEANGGNSFMSPPPMVFKMTSNYEGLRREEIHNDLSLNENTEEDYRELSTPLLEHMSIEESVQDPIATILREDENRLEQSVSSALGKNEQTIPRLREILEFEIGALSFLLALPISNLPLIQLNYSGLLTPLFDEGVFESTSLTLMDIINVITRNSGKGVFPFVTTTLFWINVVVIPFLSWICCTVAWILRTWSNQDYTKFINFAKLCNPLSHMTPFVLSILVSLTSLNQVSSFLFNENSFCPYLEDIVPVQNSSHCLQIEASIHPALVLLLLQTIASDFFINCVGSRNSRVK